MDNDLIRYNLIQYDITYLLKLSRHYTFSPCAYNEKVAILSNTLLHINEAIHLPDAEVK